MAGSRDVAAQLRELIGRSGLREGQVADRAGVARSDLRRWCRGEAVPSTYEPLEWVGVACGATEWQLDDLCRQWRDQARRPEMTHAGVRFRERSTVAPWAHQGDLYGRILTLAWEARGRLEQVDHPERPWALEDLLLDMLCSDRALRRTARQGLLPGDDGQMYREWTGDPPPIDRFRTLLLPPRATMSFSGRQVMLATWLLHPDGAMAACAAGLLRGDRDTGDGAGRPGAGSVGRAAGELAGDWVERWVAWGEATEPPPDRKLVEDGIRRCYRLSGVRWHGRVLWVASPSAGALARRLLGRLGDGAGPPPARRRPFDDLRERMDLELEWLAGPELHRQLTALVEQPVATRLALASFSGGGGSRLSTGPTDPDRVRLGLADLEALLPRRDRPRLRRLLDAADVMEPWPGPDEDAHMLGHLRAPWLARAAMLRRLCGHRVPGSLRRRLDAYRDANAAGPWWPDGEVVVVAERPRVVRSEPVASPAGPGRRLHAGDDPAVLWGDGTASFAVHGVVMPFDLMQSGWPVGRILAERNTEVRRVAIERLGWERFVVEARLALVDGPAPDPGNPGNTLSLYQLPAVYGVGARLLLCTNASPDRDGTVRRFGLHVPASIDDAVAAAAWTFGLDREAYEGLERAT